MDVSNFVCLERKAGRGACPVKVECALSVAE